MRKVREKYYHRHVSIASLSGCRHLTFLDDHHRKSHYFYRWRREVFSIHTNSNQHRNDRDEKKLSRSWRNVTKRRQWFLFFFPLSPYRDERAKRKEDSKVEKNIRNCFLLFVWAKTNLCFHFASSLRFFFIWYLSVPIRRWFSLIFFYFHFNVNGHFGIKISEIFVIFISPMTWHLTYLIDCVRLLLPYDVSSLSPVSKVTFLFSLI